MDIADCVRVSSAGTIQGFFRADRTTEVSQLIAAEPVAARPETRVAVAARERHARL